AAATPSSIQQDSSLVSCFAGSLPLGPTPSESGPPAGMIPLFQRIIKKCPRLGPFRKASYRRQGLSPIERVSAVEQAGARAHRGIDRDGPVIVLDSLLDSQAGSFGADTMPFRPLPRRHCATRLVRK